MFKCIFTFCILCESNLSKISCLGKFSPNKYICLSTSPLCHDLQYEIIMLFNYYLTYIQIRHTFLYQR